MQVKINQVDLVGVVKMGSKIFYNSPFSLQIVGHDFVKYGERSHGINLVWTNIPLDQWILKNKNESEVKNSEIKSGDIVALYNMKQSDYVVYGVRSKGINLRWLRDQSSIPRDDPYNWTIFIDQNTGRIKLKNRSNNKFLVYSDRSWGINLGWNKYSGYNSSVKQKNEQLDATLVLEKIFCRRTEDSETDQIYIKVNGDKVWGPYDMKAGNLYNVYQNIPVKIGDKVKIELFDHDSLDPDDNLGKEVINVNFGEDKVEFTGDDAFYLLFYSIENKSVLGKKEEALAYMDKYKSSIRTSPWKIDATKVFERLADLIKNPTKVNQDGLNLCGPAAFLRIWLERDPLAVAKFACKLYDTGKSNINDYKVEPDDDSLLGEDYEAIKQANGGTLAPEADWMILGSIRDSENLYFDYEGKPEEDVSAATTPGEVKEFLEATKLYSTVKDEANFYLVKGIDHALSLRLTPSKDIILLINSHILIEMKVKEGKKKSDDFILSAFPNHFVVLASDIEEYLDGSLKLSLWTWGSEMKEATIEKSVFEKNYYGAIIAEGARL